MPSTGILVAIVQFEQHRVELGHHLPGSELAEITAFCGGRTGAVRAGERGEVLLLAAGELLVHRMALTLALHQYVTR